MSYVSTPMMIEVGEALSEDERDLIRCLDRLRLMTHAQLASFLGDGSDASGARVSRRTLYRLTEQRVLARLGRRIGGVRRGSAGYVYYLGPVGQRLLSYWQGQGLTRGRFRPEPGGRYVRHRLAVSQLYVELVLAEREGLLDLIAFDAEPDCWRTLTDSFGGQTVLKPDAYIRIGVGAYEDNYFAEVDLGTESPSVIGRKLRTYIKYWRSGEEQESGGVFPRVLLVTNTEARKAVLVDVCSQLPAEAWQLFTVVTLGRAVEQLISGEREPELSL